MAQLEAEEAADVNDVLAAAGRPLKVHTDAGGVRGICVDVGDLKKVFTSRAGKNFQFSLFKFFFELSKNNNIAEAYSFLNLTFQI